MKRSTRIIAVFTTLLMCLTLLAACGGNSSAPPSSSNTTNTQTDGNANSSSMATNEAQLGVEAAPTGENVRFADEINMILDSTNIYALNPFQPGLSGASIKWAYTMIYDRLMFATPDINNPEPGLATEWHTDDYITFTFKLRDNAYFQNGEKFTADDVVFTVNYAKSIPAAPSLVSTWQYVETVTAIDDYTVEFNTGTVNVNFLFALQDPLAVIINEKAINDDPEMGILVGTGPYRLVEFVPSNYIILESNDNFWGEPRKTKKITMRYIPEQSSRAIMLLNGEAQLCMRISVEDMPSFENNPKWSVFDRIINNPSPLVFNMDHPITGDYNFRMAVLYAMDKEEISTAVSGRYAVPDTETRTMWGRYTEFKNTDIPPIVQDLDKAREYLAQSPYNGEVLEIMSGASGQPTSSLVLQQQLAAIGIKTEIKQVETAAIPTYLAWGNKTFHIYMSTMTATFSAAFFRNNVYPNSPTNYSGYNNPEVTDLIDRAMVETDYDTREFLWKEVQRIVAEDPPFTNISFPRETVVGVKGIGGIAWNTDALYNMRDLYLQIED